MWLDRALAAGNHEVSVEGFTSDTAATVVVTYSGPDTGGGGGDSKCPVQEKSHPFLITPYHNRAGGFHFTRQHHF